MKFIINLNGIILCPYQALLDVALQIPENPIRISNLAFAPICDLFTTNDWINLESLGKPVAIRAKFLCDFVCTRLKSKQVDSLSLAVYLDNGSLLADNLYSLLYLAQTFKSLHINFYTNEPQVPELKVNIEALLKMKHVSINFKNKSNKFDVQLLEELKAERDQAIHSLGLYFDESFFIDGQLTEQQLSQLIAYSWLCLKAGAYGIACTLLELAKKATANSLVKQEQLFMHLLLIRFFSNQYELITKVQFPNKFKTLEQSEINTLKFLKAYSATLSQNMPVAADYFAQCSIDNQTLLSDENSLYQLALFSMFKSLQGDTDEAFTIEFRIQDYMDAHQIETVGLRYMNFINIARLYHKTKQFDKALEFYNKAYNEISGGGYTTSDHIYYNINLASLNEESGSAEQALLYWIKTSLHWLACKNKYELSWRPRSILCQETMAQSFKPLPVDKVHEFLLAKIQHLIAHCGIVIQEKEVHPYQFIDDTVNIRREQCFIFHNILIYTGQVSAHTQVHNSSEAEKNLATFISHYLHTVMDIPNDHNVYIVDTHLDTKFIHNAEQAIAFAHLSNCSTCYYNGEWIKLENFEAIQPMAASLSKVIQSISETDKGLLINYKRSFLNKTLLEQGEIDLVNQLKQTDFLKLERITNSMWNNIHQLAKKRILSFTYPDLEGSA